MHPITFTLPISLLATEIAIQQYLTPRFSSQNLRNEMQKWLVYFLLPPAEIKQLSLSEGCFYNDLPPLSPGISYTPDKESVNRICSLYSKVLMVLNAARADEKILDEVGETKPALSCKCSDAGDLLIIHLDYQLSYGEYLSDFPSSSRQYFTISYPAIAIPVSNLSGYYQKSLELPSGEKMVRSATGDASISLLVNERFNLI